MKKLKCISLFICLWFFGIVNVYADDTLNLDNVEVECTYSDGSLIVYADKTFYREVFPGFNNNDPSIMNYVFIDADNAPNSLKPSGQFLKCPETLYKAVYSTDDAKAALLSFEESKVKELDSLANRFIFWLSGITPEEGESGEYDLISESIYFTEDIRTLVDCDYISEQKQIVGNNMYISLTKYRDGQIILENYGKATNVIETNDLFGDDVCPEEIYINNAEVYLGENLTNPKYKFSDPRYVISNKKSDDTPNHFRLLTDEEKEDMKNPPVDVCKEIPNTILIVKDFVKILSVAVPIIIIVASSIEFFKTMYSGNMEEDFKKAFNHFKYRLLLLIIFAFLPLIINLLLRMLFNVGIIPISDINCLLR